MSGRGETHRAAIFIDNPVFGRAAWNALHPLAFSRQQAVRDMVEAMGWIEQSELRECPIATPETLARFHAPDYIAALQAAVARGKVTAEERTRYGFGTMENPIFPGLFERAAATVGGSIAAARVALQGHIAFHPAGGTHHGKPDRASGFCYFNDPAFAIATFLDAALDRVLYLDLDAHHGDGVEAIFAGDSRVHTLSLHEAGRWPHSGTPDNPGPANATNFAVPRAINDAEYDWLIQGPVAEVAGRFAPQAIVVTAGVDCLHGDPLSAMELSNRALWRAVECALGWAPHIAVLGGGGYNPWTVTRGWAGMWAVLSGRDPGEVPNEAARALLAGFESDLIDEDEIEPEWLDSVADAPRPGPIRADVMHCAQAALERR
ncbi:MAG: acetoin utilization protein AcuC [Sphingomonadales bacterium]|nr:acetoin utilization protein AcuC [Sphingomonadales bacterium]MBD3772667.1 acetoin utilization protein AcuC [Paracoccaceae bacterium]